MNKDYTKDMIKLARGVKAASSELANLDSEVKNKALENIADRLLANKKTILKANENDRKRAINNNISEAFLDRMTLDEGRIDAMAKGVLDIALLNDPVNEVMTSWERPNGLVISRVRVPIGVMGIIYESRPNVTSDAAALCIKSGNGCILRGGSDCFETNHAILEYVKDGLKLAGISDEVVAMVPSADREYVGMMLRGLEGNLDVIVPRGGKSLVERVHNESRIPVFSHLEGICHAYIDKDADIEKACNIVVNAKLRRTGICGALESLLISRDAHEKIKHKVIKSLLDEGCEVRGDAYIQAIDDRVKPASDEDWTTEYHDKIISCKIVLSLDEAIEHISNYGSHHTDTIITENMQVAEEFLKKVDSAIVMHNASTQFADGGEFGMGAEIGIATGRMHARGPVGVEQLTIYKYVVKGDGQVRPL